MLPDGISWITSGFIMPMSASISIYFFYFQVWHLLLNHVWFQMISDVRHIYIYMIHQALDQKIWYPHDSTGFLHPQFSWRSHHSSQCLMSFDGLLVIPILDFRSIHQYIQHLSIPMIPIRSPSHPTIPNIILLEVSPWNPSISTRGL